LREVASYIFGLYKVANHSRGYWPAHYLVRYRLGSGVSPEEDGLNLDELVRQPEADRRCHLPDGRGAFVQSASMRALLAAITAGQSGSAR
jgi:hypothetical protein